MKHKHLTIDCSSQRKLIERINYSLIRFFIILYQHLFTKVIVFCHFARLVIASKQKDLVRVAYFHGKKKGDAFRPISATIDIVAKKEELFVTFTKSLPCKNLAQIIILTMNIAKHNCFATNAERIRLSRHDISSLTYYFDKTLFSELTSGFLIFPYELNIWDVWILSAIDPRSLEQFLCKSGYLSDLTVT